VREPLILLLVFCQNCGRVENVEVFIWRWQP